MVLDGRQRTKNAIEANKRIVSAGGERIKIPAIYKRGTESSLYGITITTNEHRVNDDPIEKAAKINHMLNFGKSKRECAVLFGVTTQTIDKWLELLTLPRETREQISAGDVKPTNAIKASRLPEKQRRNVLSAPRMQKKKDIEGMLESLARGEKSMSAIDALNWVLCK